MLIDYPNIYPNETIADIAIILFKNFFKTIEIK